MTGPVALHGGGEFLPGDEPFLLAILGLAPRMDGIVRIAVVPTAAARGRPELAAANGVAALRRVADDAGIEALVDAVPVVDAASAADPSHVDRLDRATLIHLPGGDPDIIPTLYPGSDAWAAIERARARGAVLAGASAGAMALAEWTWTKDGGLKGLGVVPGIGVAPHVGAANWQQVVVRYGAAVPPDLDFIGLAERTGVIVPPAAGHPWEVVGEGEVRWLTAGARAAGEPPLVARSFDRIER